MSKLPEKCPVCGEKMEKGYLYHAGLIYWGKKKQRWFPEVEPMFGCVLQGLLILLKDTGAETVRLSYSVM